jgi:multidrug efflux pump subunit AcrA (membrane-fusion protein)
MVAPLRNVAITSTLAEPADAVYVEEGDRVNSGQVLAVLDTADLQAQLAADLGTAAGNRAKAEQTFGQAGLTIAQNANTVNAARAALHQAQQTLANDERTLQRQAELLKSGYVAQSQYDQQSTVVRNDREAVRAAEVTLQNDVTQVRANGTTSTGMQGAAVAAARAEEQTALAQAQQVRVQIAKARIVSPIDGVVVNRNLNPGEFPGTRQIFTIQQVDRVFAMLNAAASQIVGIRDGSDVTLRSDAIPGESLRGKVVGVLNAVQPGSTNFVVKALVENRRGVLRPGMVVMGTASLPSASGIRIPKTAFLDTTNSTIQIVRDEGKARTVRTVRVTMLAADDRNAIVRGLAPGENVVANGQLGLADGQPVATEQVAQR